MVTVICVHDVAFFTAFLQQSCQLWLVSVHTVAVVRFSVSNTCYVYHSVETVKLLSDCFVMEMCFLGIKNRIVVFFLLDESPASEFYVPTFRNTLSVPYL
jgi:hypothetical protein